MKKIAIRISATAAATLLLGAGLMAPAGAQTAAVEPVTVRAVANFNFDRDDLRADDRDEILSEVHKLEDVTWQSVTATGHTDSVGPEEYNADLSARRARAVKDYLVGKGLDPGMINTAARAEDAPVAGNDTAAGRAQNRRTEIEFKGVRAATR